MSDIQALITEHLAIWTGADTEKKSGRGRASGSAVSVYGIKKLRELILELAVRGKLVPQDANDEPASELLKRIEAEKEKLIKEGKIKKSKPFAPISEDEKPFELPKGWEWVRLGNVSQINPRNDAEDELEVSFVPMTLISTSHTGKHEQETRLWGELKKGFTHFAEGDIGVAKITPCFENSKAAVFSGLVNGIGAGTTELHIVRPFRATFEPRFILIYFKSPQFLFVGESKMTGTAGQKRVPKEFVSDNPFPLPPLAEQHRIVAKVDELMTLCDQLENQHLDATAAHEKLVSYLLDALTQSQDAAEFNESWQRIAANFDTLFNTESSIDALKQTLLQLAVMGKLVPQDANDEPASELLKRIQAEKEKLIAEGKIRKDKPLAAIGDDEKPFELAKGWEWVRLGSLGVCSTGGTPNTQNSAFYGADIPFIGPAQITPNNILLSADKWLSELARRETTIANNGDILMVCIGGSIGKSAIANMEVSFNQQINCIHPIFACSNYIHFSMQSPHFQMSILGAATGSATPIINRTKWEELLIAIPPLAEQQRIVAKVDELMALCDTLKSHITTANQLQQKIADVLVEQAVV